MIVGLKQLRGFYLVILDKEVASAFSAFILFESSMIGVMVCKFISVVLHRGFFILFVPIINYLVLPFGCA